MFTLVDTHCHLDADEFDRDRDAVVARAHDAGVLAQVVPATHASAWPKLRDVCAADPGLHPAYGLHPTFLEHHRHEHLQELGAWIERERPLAVGECGLDYWVEGLDRGLQQDFFDGQLELARDHSLPVVVHARRAVDAVIASIRRVGDVHGVVHSFSGSPQQAGQLWDLGFMIGIGGPVTYERARRLRRLVADMPLEHLLLETDAPDQPDSENRGGRNEPALMVRVLDTIAGLRKQDREEIASITTANARRLFNLPDPAQDPGTA